jgi:hypothetical protein
MNAHLTSHDSNHHLNLEATLVSTLLVAFTLAVVSAGQLGVAVRLLGLVGVWFVAVAFLVGLVFAAVTLVGSVEA